MRTELDRLFTAMLSGAADRPARHAQFARLHAIGGIYFHAASGCWLIGAHRLCHESLRSASLGSDWCQYMLDLGLPDWPRHPALRRIGSMVISANGREHRRLRRYARPLMAAGRIERLRAVARRHAQTLLDGVTDGEIDLVSGYAQLLPLDLIGAATGIRPEDAEAFRTWVQAYNAVLSEGDIRGALPAADAAAVAMERYICEIFDRARRGQARGSLLATLASTRVEGVALSRDELVSMAIALIAGGFDTTAHLIGNGLAELLRHPGQLAALREQGGLGDAVEEILRFEPPVQLVPRSALGPLSLGGHRIERGGAVTVLLGAANFDPGVFDRPEDFDITRPARTRARALGFGAGPHQCLGAPLARMEVEVAIGTLLDRFRAIDVLDRGGAYRPRFSRSTLQSLRVSVRS